MEEKIMIPEMIEGKNIVVWFSCGAPSAVASKLIVEKYGNANNVAIVNNPVNEEDEDNRRIGCKSSL